MCARWLWPWVAAVLAGCGGSPVGESVRFGGAHIGVLQGDDSYEAGVQFDQGRILSLRGQRTARIDAAWLLGSQRLVLISGAGKDCPHLETLVIAQGDSAQLQPLGKCRDRFATSLSGEQWSARQLNVRDPQIWSFRDGKLSGPVTQSALNARRNPAPETSPQADPAQPPSISRPVGDDVVPRPVGAGPLPGRPPPRLF